MSVSIYEQEAHVLLSKVVLTADPSLCGQKCPLASEAEEQFVLLAEFHSHASIQIRVSTSKEYTIIIFKRVVYTALSTPHCDSSFLHDQ